MFDDTGSRASVWLSRDLAELAEELHLAEEAPDSVDAAPHFDVVIVGSGYGGSVALYELAGYGSAGRPLRILMLERGAEYLSGSFPTRLSELAGHVRFCTADDPHVRGEATGLFDVRVGADVTMLLGSGLGGGSLINAGVMEAPLPSVFAEACWPEEIRRDAALAGALESMKSFLEATPAAVVPQRASVMNSLGGPGGSIAPSITVAQKDDASRGIVACSQCGDCATGCNIGAKLSVDVTLLARASARHDRASLRIVTGATVQTFLQTCDGGVELHVFHTDSGLRRRQTRPYRLRTRRLILAAGTMGSTELLMRAGADGLTLSKEQLGRRFSTNGDMVSAICGTELETRGSAKEGTPLQGRGVGPTITRMIDRRAADVASGAPGARQDEPFVVQDLGIPAALRRALEEAAATGTLLKSLTRFDRPLWAAFARGQRPDLDVAGIDPSVVDRSVVVALIGRDDASGSLVLPAGFEREAAGSLGVRWPELKADPRSDRYQAALEHLAAHGHRGSTVVANPGWRPLPAAIERMFGSVRGPAVTVHPLGGCAMADDARHGVVNSLGQVFRGDEGTSVHTNVVVLDGAIVPGSLGINPSLTIATLAQRAIRRLRDGAWGLERTPRSSREMLAKPVFRTITVPVPESSTTFEVNERMTGTAVVKVDGEVLACTVVLQLRFQPIATEELTAASSARLLRLDETRSAITIFEKSPPRPAVLKIDPRAPSQTPAVSSGRVILQAPLSGTMQVLARTPAGFFLRTLRGITTWLINRGLRDLVTAAKNRIRGRRPTNAAGFWTGLLSALQLASHAGNRRLLAYELDIGVPRGSDEHTGIWQGKRLSAVKTLSYGFAANPVSQLMRADVTNAPAGLRMDRELKVDLPYFASAGVPLFRIAKQSNQPRALMDSLSTSLFLMRALLPLHAWSLRLPDAPAQTEAGTFFHPARFSASRRLPGALRGLPSPEFASLQTPDGARFNLTRYRPLQAPSPHPPILTIHGYSASGTTFAHPLLPSGGLAGYLGFRGREVWVLDLRSSSGMRTAQKDWIFEQMACQDIPLAVAHIVRATGHPKIDVVAHCMGAAMLSLGLFGHWSRPAPFDACPNERSAMRQRIRRLVLSQVGPAVVMSPANTARAYAISWIRHYTRLGKFEFRNLRPTTASRMLDRVLNIVPYPREDYFRENPLSPPWKTTQWASVRHRMDALYGVTFKLSNMSDPVLERIDEFFGPLSLETASQVLAFARQRLVTDRAGNGSFMSPANMRSFKDVRVLCLHSEENGLADVSTREHLLDLLQAAGVRGKSVVLKGMGHQDSLIGTRAEEVFGHVHDFVSEP